MRNRISSIHIASTTYYFIQRTGPFFSTYISHRFRHVKEFLAKHGIVLNPATLQLGYQLKKAPLLLGKKRLFSIWAKMVLFPLWVTVVEFLI
jgi:hypothetical protein